VIGFRKFRVKGFAGGKHPRGVRLGTLLIETVHGSEASAYAELCAHAARIKRGEESYAVLIDMRDHDDRPGGKDLTNLHVTSEHDVEWSWAGHARKQS
jgi:hypothetical protein